MTSPGSLLRRRGAGSDDGAALIVALALVTVFAIGIAALLAFADTSLRTTITVRSVAATDYAADGAVNAAISTLRHNRFNNDSSSATLPKCFGAAADSDTLTLPNFYPGTTGGAATSAAVTCSPDPNTGAAGGLVPITSSNKPGNAILTLGTDPGEDGINVKALNNSVPFTVHGGIVSDSNIRVTNGKLRTNAAVYAHTGCSGTIESTPAAGCSAGTVADPNYAPETSTVPAYRVAPSSCSAVTTFDPGYYDDASALNNLTASNGCRNSVFWFKPGVYYFDFHNSGTQNPLLSGSDVWNVTGGTLIAGTPVNAAGTVLAAPPSNATVPGACQNPIKTTGANGVQFVFGGDSQLAVDKTADVEICGTYSTNRPPIAVYGLKSGTATPTPLTGLAGANASNTGTATFTPATGTLAGAVNAADGAYDTWTKSTGNNSQTATLNLASLANAPTVPAGSIVTAAKLRVVYGTSAAVTSRQIVLTPTTTSGTGPAVTKALAASAQTNNSTQTVDLLDTSANGLAATVHTAGLTNLAISYSVTSKTANENIDAVLLDITYTVPAWRGQTTASVPGNCLSATYTGTGSGSCALIYTPSSYKGGFYIQGTTYVPNAVLDLTLSNITTQVLRFGVIARSLWVKETGSISYVGPVIEIPDNSPGYGPGGTVVYLTAYVCEAVSTCSASTGSLRLRARVLIFDPSGTPSPPAREVTVQSWAHRA